MMNKVKKKIESEQTTEIVSHFKAYIDSIQILSPEKSKILSLLGTLTKKYPSLSYEYFYKMVFLLFSNVEKSFLEMRETAFFSSLFEKLAETEFKIQNNGKIGDCLISPLLHEVSFPFQSKNVLGVLIHFTNIKSLKIHIEKIKPVILDMIKDTYYVEGSLFHLIDKSQETSAMYFEIQKPDDSFTEKEILTLNEKAPGLILKKVKESNHIILPSNRELLAKSFRLIINEMTPNDLPQVCIDFSKNIEDSYQFSLLICNIRKPDEPSIQSKLIHTSIHVDGVMTLEGEEFCKEGVTASIELFLSSSTPIDARKEVADLLQSLIGPFRDVNGGLLEKVEENLQKFSESVKLPASDLKSFFYAISPQEKQATANPLLLKLLYFALERQKNGEAEDDFEVEENEFEICITMKLPKSPFEAELKSLLYKSYPDLLVASAQTETSTIVSCAIGKMDESDFKRIKKIARTFYQKWIEKKEVKQVIKLGNKCEYTSLDPRTGSDEGTIYVTKMLFEGLTRINSEGIVENAIADSIEISKTQLIYRFHLKKTFWSDGSPLTAHDFVYSWQTSLHPEFKSPLSYLFFCIKNAEKAKNGEIFLDSIGIHAITDEILQVELCHPVPYFLELCAYPIFFPVCKKIDEQNPSWPKGTGSNYVCNGPFKIKTIHSFREIILEKNSKYWEIDQIKLEKVMIFLQKDNEYLDLIKKNQIDGIIYPRFDKNISLEEYDFLEIKGRTGVYFLYFNCLKLPFTNRKIRKAISLAINRKELVSTFSLKATTYYKHYSPYFSQLNVDVEEKENLELARKLFSEGLKQLRIEKKQIHNESIYVVPINKTLGQSLVNQINSAFDLNWNIKVEEVKKIINLATNRKIKMSIYRWIDRISDPNYYLETFASSENPINRSCWTSVELQKLISKIRESNSTEEKSLLHVKAEKHLFNETPTVPLFSAIPVSYLHKNILSVCSNQLVDLEIIKSYKI